MMAVDATNDVWSSPTLGIPGDNIEGALGVGEVEPSLPQLTLALAQVQYARRARMRARLPSTHLALTEQALVSQLRQRGVILRHREPAKPTTTFAGLG